MKNITFNRYFFQDNPKQKNTDDCGVFVCEYAKCIVMDEDLKFNFIQAEANQIGIIMLQSIFVEVIEESFEENHVERSFQLTQEEI